MHFVMATKAGEWLTACEHQIDESSPPKPLVYLAMALEGEAGAPATWNVNGEGIEVESGLVLGFERIEDAKHFLDTPRGRQPRATRLVMAEGDVVAFHNIDHAMWFVRTGRAEYLTEEQVRQMQDNAERRQFGAPDASPTSGPNTPLAETENDPNSEASAPPPRRSSRKAAP